VSEVPNLAEGLEIPRDRHPGTQHFRKMFAYGHLTGQGREISSACAATAQHMVDNVPDGPELSAGLRKLWEAKNSFVIATML
jgi:hypothetical protein